MTPPKSGAERARDYRDRVRGGPPRVPKGCGTVAAVRRHHRAGEPLCPACAEAWRAYQRDGYRRRKGQG